MTGDEQMELDSEKPAPRRWKSRIVAILAWAYLVGIVALWVFLKLEGDRWWVGVVAMFGPRWICALPLILLIPFAWALHRRSLWILALGTLIAVFPVMGFCIPWNRLIQQNKSARSIRVLTCNVHHYALDPTRLADVIASVHPDIVVLQEWDPQYELPVFGTSGWNVTVGGEMALATRFPIQAAKELPGTSAFGYTINTPAGAIDVFNVHLSSPHIPLRDAIVGTPNAENILETNSAIRERESRELRELSRKIHGPLLIAGDFNLPPDSTIFRDNFSEMADAFTAAGFGFGWTYRGDWTTTRIDHILSNSQWTCEDCWVGSDVGSPHRPLIADFSVRGAQ